ncbi:MAG: hypothetical protein J0I10_22985 [Verrucomicrobia bacterium]|nr:hypothetical protein [Verrucomicrobiota bacterium]
MLTEDEWEIIHPLLVLNLKQIQDIRVEKGLALDQALAEYRSLACEKFEQMTGYQETNMNAIWHHRRSLFGRECPSCGHLFRTPQSRFCAHCGCRSLP